MRIDPDTFGDSATAPEYVERVNRAIDHILRHLEHPLQLDAIAEVACFSPFHFHRVFRAIVGETLHQFVKRLRLERALDWLFGTWLLGSGFAPTDQPSFEAWIGRPFAHGLEHFELFAPLPVARVQA